MAIFQVATSQMCNFSRGNFPKFRLGSLMRSWLQWEPSAAARIDLGSCRLANWTMGSHHLGNYLWKVATWWNSLGKKPSSFYYLVKVNSNVPSIITLFKLIVQSWVLLPCFCYLYSPEYYYHVYVDSTVLSIITMFMLIVQFWVLLPC